MKEIKDKKLRENFHSAIKEILEHLTKKLGVQIKDISTSIGVSGLYTLFRVYFPELKDNKSINLFEETFLENKDYARHNLEKFGVKQWFWPFSITRLLESTIVYYIKEYGLDYNENYVDKFYEDLELLLIENKIKIVIKTPINGLQTTEKEIKINDEVSIKQIEGQRKLQSSESTQMVNYAMAFHDMVYTFYQTKYFESDTSENETDEKDWKTARSHIRDFMMVLRLYRSGKIGFLDSNLEYSVSHSGNTWQNQDCSLESDWNKWKDFPCIISPLDVEGLQNLWSEIHKIDFQQSKNKFLLSAIERFMVSYQKDNVEDKIVDLMICLEALLLDNSAELQFRLSIRTASLIGKNNNEKNHINKIMKSSYEVRSKTVHGTEFSNVKIDGNEISLEALHRELEEITRVGVKIFISKINNNEKRNTIIENLDNTLFSN